MSKITRSKDNIYNTLRKFQDEFYDLGRTDLHDPIYYQMEGLAEDWDDLDRSTQEKLSELVDSLELHLEWLKVQPKLNWIYG